MLNVMKLGLVLAVALHFVTPANGQDGGQSSQAASQLAADALAATDGDYEQATATLQSILYHLGACARTTRCAAQVTSVMQALELLALAAYPAEGGEIEQEPEDEQLSESEVVEEEVVEEYAEATESADDYEEYI